MCRKTQLEIFRKPPKSKREGESLCTVVWPTGYTFPNEGGLENQNYMEMRLFAAALAGEQDAAAQQIKQR